jgi:bifunctional DNA-binding transcriptional regulator/antitoxin component of YhaV-PrlF toxin-antitoxin module
MAEVRLRVDENGRVAPSAPLRKALNIRPGDHVLAGSRTKVGSRC